MQNGVLSSKEETILASLLYGSSGLSLCGSAVILVTYLLFKETRTFGTSLIFWLSVTDFFTSLSWMPWNLTVELCTLQAVTLQFFEVASYLWSLTISLSLFKVFYLERMADSPKNFLLITHLVNWSYPTLSVALCLAFNKFGKAGSWCWVRDPTDPFRLLSYGPMLLILLFSCFSWCAIRCKLSAFDSDFKRRLNRRLSFYLLAYISSQLPACINRLQNFFEPEKPIFVLFVLQALFQPAQGFFNCLVYGFTEQQFVEHYRNLFSRWRCCCFRDRTMRKKNFNASLGNHSLEESPFFDYDYSSDNE